MCSKIKEVVRVVFCGKCGLKIKDGNIFCTNCIESVEGT